MKKLSRLLAVVLAVLMLATAFAGCHEENEIAFTIGESKFTSAMFSCVQVVASQSAQNAIYNYVSESGGDTSAEIDYTKYKFDAENNVSPTGTVSYTKFVRSEAIDTLRRFAVLEAKFKEHGLELDEDTKLSAQLNAQSYWAYGCDYNTYMNAAQNGQLSILPYSYLPEYYLMEQNGVAYSTYEKYFMYEYMYDHYFDYLYGEDGTQAIPKDDINKYMTDNHAIADVISFSKKDSDNKDLSEEKLAELKAIADGYAERLNAGEKFEDIYKEENKRLEEEAKADSSSSGSSTTSDASSDTASSEDTTSTDTTSSDTTTSGSEDKEYTPPEYTGIFGSAETDYEHAMFEEVKKQELGKAVVLEDTENKQYLLVVRRDMLEEDYWYTNLRTSIAYALKQDEFDAALNEAGNALKLTEDTHATSPFDVEDINSEIEY